MTEQTIKPPAVPSSPWAPEEPDSFILHSMMDMDPTFCHQQLMHCLQSCHLPSHQRGLTNPSKNLIPPLSPLPCSLPHLHMPHQPHPLLLHLGLSSQTSSGWPTLKSPCWINRSKSSTTRRWFFSGGQAKRISRF